MTSATNEAGHPAQRRTGAGRLLPLLGWLPDYDRRVLRADVAAGLTVAVMLVPQSMAYASLAGMPPATGLYAAIVPLVVYALLGTSGKLSVGPVAITSLMTAASLGPLAEGDPSRYATLAGLLALMVGALQLLMGALRLGAAVTLLSHPVLTGFTSAAAVTIAVGQLPDLLGTGGGDTATLPAAASTVASGLGAVNGPTVAVAVASLAVLVLAKRFAPKAPGPLLVVAGATTASALWSLGARGVDVLGQVPAGLPLPSVPSAPLQDLTSLAPAALAIALVGYLEGIAVANAMAARDRRRVSPDGELVAVGAANVSAGLFSGFPIAGGLARSAVNRSAGARTPIAGLITAAAMVLTALLLTPLFTHLPTAALAATIVVAVIGLVDVRGAMHVWRTRRPDGAALATTFAVTLLAGVEAGLLAGVVFSLLAFLWRSSHPHTARLGRVPGTDVFRNVERYPGLQVDPAVPVLRIDGPLYFANARRITDSVTAAVRDLPAPSAVVLDASAISDCDSDGAQALGDLDQALADRGVVLHLATARGPVRDVLARDGVWDRLQNRVHADTADAVEGAYGTGRSRVPDGVL